MSNTVKYPSLQGLQVYQSTKTTTPEASAKSGVFDQLVAQPLKEVVSAVHAQEEGIEKSLKGELSEDELLLLIKEAEIQLEKATAIASRLVRATEQINQAAGA